MGECMMEWLIERMHGWVDEWKNEWASDWINARMDEQMYTQMNEGMKEWVKERIKQWMDERTHEPRTRTNEQTHDWRLMKTMRVIGVDETVTNTGRDSQSDWRASLLSVIVTTWVNVHLSKLGLHILQLPQHRHPGCPCPVHRQGLVPEQATGWGAPFLTPGWYEEERNHQGQLSGSVLRLRWSIHCWCRLQSMP
jgi:hypothetical protein